jgi:hypothetical protein
MRSSPLLLLLHEHRDVKKDKTKQKRLDMCSSFMFAHSHLIATRCVLVVVVIRDKSALRQFGCCCCPMREQMLSIKLCARIMSLSASVCSAARSFINMSAGGEDFFGVYLFERLIFCNFFSFLSRESSIFVCSSREKENSFFFAEIILSVNLHNQR